MEPVSSAHRRSYSPRRPPARVATTGGSRCSKEGMPRHLGRFLAARVRFSAATAGRCREGASARDAELGGEWEGYVGLRRKLIGTMEATAPAESIALLRQQMAERDARWNETVFAARTSAPGTLAAAVDVRQHFVRRFDPIRMAAERRNSPSRSVCGLGGLPMESRSRRGVSPTGRFLWYQRRRGSSAARGIGKPVARQTPAVSGLPKCASSGGYK